VDKLRRRTIWLGALAGLLGGLVFGVSLADQGMITSIAGLFRLNNSLFGWGIHLILSVIIGGL